MGEAKSSKRYELKYYLPRREQPAIREWIEPYLYHDPNATGTDGTYTVRSIYFDSDDLRFYYEKMDGVKVRKKLRVRTYNNREDGAPAFLEIKRKYDRTGFKERLRLPMDLVDPALNGIPPSEITQERPFRDRKVLEKFRYNLKTSNLRPVVLVVYEREAFLAAENPTTRVTFDQNIRSLIDPKLEQIFDDGELEQFEDKNFVLELKFNRQMPKWMSRLVTALYIHTVPYSKYCHGIDAWETHAK